MVEIEFTNDIYIPEGEKGKCMRRMGDKQQKGKEKDYKMELK